MLTAFIVIGLVLGLIVIGCAVLFCIAEAKCDAARVEIYSETRR